MLRIITHIERVLMVSDCVIVPDFGGFVLRRRPALFTAEKNAFSPAHNEIVFNPALNHDDGLLTESYMQMSVKHSKPSDKTWTNGREYLMITERFHPVDSDRSAGTKMGHLSSSRRPLIIPLTYMG